MMTAFRRFKVFCGVAVSTLGVLALLLTAGSDVVTTRFAARKDAQAAGAFERGWLPPLPASASNIVEKNNLDLNTGTGSFRYAPSEREDYLAELSRGGAVIKTNEQAFTAILTSSRSRWEIRLKPDAGEGAYTIQPFTNTFGIYLVLDWADGRRSTGYGLPIDLSSLTLTNKPSISNEDIVSYDFATHSIQLKPGVLSRLPRPPVSGLPFVVVANGERIYAGVFVTMFSSFSFRVPSLLVDSARWNTNTPPNTLIIGPGYPPQRAGPQAEMRSDPRIRQALAGLIKK